MRKVSFGFSLIELIMAILVSAIITTLFVPKLLNLQ
ncbi:hypothetical protein CJF42_21035 [Pseudoalteromonas sp. NBT06-2]|nr:hypothetical protein CJF42_21035 [Pseudoalteromonas sp. NBT06-2]